MQIDTKLTMYYKVDDSVTIPTPKDFGFIPVPRRLRYDPTKPFHFSLAMNIAFGVISTFSMSAFKPGIANVSTLGHDLRE